MSAVIGQGDPSTPDGRDRRSTTALPQRIGQACVAPATFSAPAPAVSSSARPRSCDRTLAFSDQGRIECNVDECECASAQTHSDAYMHVRVHIECVPDT